MSEQNTTPVAEQIAIPVMPVITQEIVKAQFNKQLTLQKYSGALQKLLDFKVTQDNIKEAQELLKEGRKVIAAFDKIHEEGKAPAWKICKFWDNTLNSIKNPYKDALGDIDKNVQVESKKAAAEDARKQKEKDRVNEINVMIDNFILQQSSVITNATTPEQLTTVEKFIGSHKANTSRYQEFLPTLVERCNELTPLIKKQKGNIKTLADLEKQRQDALKKDDDRAVLEIEEKKEVIESAIEEKKIQIQETAINFATRPDAITTPEPVMNAIKPRRRSWNFEIVDEKKAFLTGMLITELNKEKVKAKFEEIKDTIEGTETTIDGIKYFYKETY